MKKLLFTLCIFIYSMPAFCLTDAQLYSACTTTGKNNIILCTGYFSGFTDGIAQSASLNRQYVRQCSYLTSNAAIVGNLVLSYSQHYKDLQKQPPVLTEAAGRNTPAYTAMLAYKDICKLPDVQTPRRKKHKHPESYYQHQDCKGQTEFKFDDNTRADCLTDDYVTEYDFAPKWAEAVGQVLHYSLKSGKKPRIVLIADKKQYDRFITIAKPFCAEYNIKLDVIYDY